MNNEEIKAKDWQLLTAHSSLVTVAYCKTIFEYQCKILSALENRDIKEIQKEMAEALKEHYNDTKQSIKKDIPNYPDAGYFPL